MPPKGKKKRASLRLDTDSGVIKEEEVSEHVPEDKKPAPVRQVVEVVDDVVSESIETIKKDVDEIEEAVEAVEDKIQNETPHDIPQHKEEQVSDTIKEEVAEDAKGSVESLFVKSTSPISPDITVVGKKNTSLGIWVGAMLGIVLAVGVSLVFFVRGPSTLPFLAVKPTPTPTETPAPTPTPAGEIKREKIIVSILNGGGVVGAGGKMKTFLESKGYTVESVGNADEYTYDQTEISVKSGQDAVAALLKGDLSSDYTVASATGIVKADALYDVQIIVGKK